LAWTSDSDSDSDAGWEWVFDLGLQLEIGLSALAAAFLAQNFHLFWPRKAAFDLPSLCCASCFVFTFLQFSHHLCKDTFEF